jgi:hypothetical protein
MVAGMTPYFCNFLTGIGSTRSGSLGFLQKRVQTFIGVMFAPLSVDYRKLASEGAKTPAGNDLPYGHRMVV